MDFLIFGITLQKYIGTTSQPSKTNFRRIKACYRYLCRKIKVVQRLFKYILLFRLVPLGGFTKPVQKCFNALTLILEPEAARHNQTHRTGVHSLAELLVAAAEERTAQDLQYLYFRGRHTFGEHVAIESVDFVQQQRVKVCREDVVGQDV